MYRGEDATRRNQVTEGGYSSGSTFALRIIYMFTITTTITSMYMYIVYIKNENICYIYISLNKVYIHDMCGWICW